MGHHTTGDIVGVSIAGTVIWIFLLGLVRVFGKVFRSNPEPQKLDEDQPHFDHVKRAVKQLPDGSWVAAKIGWEPCAPPMAPNDTEPHFPLDKNHRASCKRCQQEYSRGARMPHAN